MDDVVDKVTDVETIYKLLDIRTWITYSTYEKV
jgi:hypothetical protein